MGVSVDRGGLRMSYCDILVEALDALLLVALSFVISSVPYAVPEVWRMSSPAMETGRLSSWGGGRDMTESAPTVGMNPSGGIDVERWDRVGLGGRSKLRLRMS